MNQEDQTIASHLPGHSPENPTVDQQCAPVGPHEEYMIPEPGYDFDSEGAILATNRGWTRL